MKKLSIVESFDYGQYGIILKLHALRSHAQASQYSEVRTSTKNADSVANDTAYSRAAEQTVMSAAACFVRVAAKLSVAYTVSGHSSYQQLGGLTLLFNRAGVASMDPVQIMAILRNLFYMLLSASSAGAAVVVASRTEQSYDAASLSYAMLQHFGSTNFIASQLSETRPGSLAGLIGEASQHNVDILVLIDDGFTDRELTPVDGGDFMIIGLSSRRFSLRYMDSVVPVDATTPEVRYFFCEFLLCALSAGSRAGASSVAMFKSRISNVFDY